MSAAEPAGDAEGDGATREVRYTEPWDREVGKRNLEKVQLILKFFIIFWTITILLVGIFIGIYIPNISVGSFLFGLSMVLLMLSIGCLIIKGIVVDVINDSLENRGWYNNGKILIGFIRALGLPTLIFSPFIIIGLFFQGRLNFMELWMIPVIISWLLFERFYVPYQQFIRVIDLPIVDVKNALEISYQRFLPYGEIKNNRFAGWKLVDGRVKIFIIRRGINYSSVVVWTPRDQSERNRELREAVSAVLEGRPWPPDSRSRDEARPEGDA